MSFLDPIKEAQAVASLRESLAAVDAEDETLLYDSIEGQTSFLEIVDGIIERIGVAEAGVEGLNAIIDRLEARRLRYETRIKNDRALIEQAMTIADLTKLERPGATLSITTRPPSLQVLEEADIPQRYWKPGKPTLDKKALTADLKERAKAVEVGADDIPEPIPGATLSNGAPSLTLRRA